MKKRAKDTEKKPTKLKIEKETIKELTDQELEGAAGGWVVASLKGCLAPGGGVQTIDTTRMTGTCFTEFSSCVCGR